MLKNPSMFVSTYGLGFINECLTPAWAAKLKTYLTVNVSQIKHILNYLVLNTCEYHLIMVASLLD